MLAARFYTPVLIMSQLSRSPILHAFLSSRFQTQYFLMPLFAFLLANTEYRLSTGALYNIGYI